MAETEIKEILQKKKYLDQQHFTAIQVNMKVYKELGIF